MADEPRLVTILEARLNKFEKDLKAAGNIADREVKRIESKFSQMNPNLGFVGNFAKGALAALTLEKALTAVINTVRDVAKIGDVAERVGITAEALQELAFAIKLNGGEAEQASTGMERFSNNMAKAAQGAGYLAQVFKANGVAISQDMMTNLMNMANLIQNTKGEMNQMNLAFEAFGRKDGPAFVLAMKGGSAGLVEFMQKGRDAGAVIKNDLVAKARDFDDQLDLLILKLKAQAGGKIIEWIESIQKWLNKLDEWAAKVLPILEAINKYNPVQWGLDAAGVGNFDSTSGTAKGRTGAKVVVSKGGNTVLPPRGGTEDSFQKEMEQMQKRIEIMNAETDAIDKGTVAVERARVMIELETAAKEANKKAGMANTEVTEAQRAKINELADAYALAAERAKAAKNPLAEFGRAARDVTLQLQEAGVQGLKGFEDALIAIGTKTKTVAEAFKDMANSIISDLARIAIRSSITGPLASMMGFGGMGGFGLPFMAGGGTLGAGQPAIVGEKGPELFVPRTAGRVVPNGVSARGVGGPSVVVANTYHFDAGIGPADMALIRAQIMASEQRTKGDVVGIVRGALRRDSDALSR